MHGAPHEAFLGSGENMNDVIENEVTGIQHIGIPSGDMEATAAFFTALGFREIFRTTIAPENQFVRFFSLKDIQIETYAVQEPAAKSGAIDHFTLNVKDIERVYQGVRDAGFSAIEGKICYLPFFEQGVRYFTIEGPGKEKIEFNQKL